MESKISDFVMMIMIIMIGNRNLKIGVALNNNLALTPPMGWSSWERFRCNLDCRNFPDECISENLYRSMADRMVEDGYLAAGYQYVLLDDCWLAKSRDQDGRLQPDPYRFPSGIKNLSEYIHSRGLKFGIYEDYGTHTCEGYPGVRDHTMEIDSRLFAYWEVDYVKLDGCYCDPIEMDRGYPAFGQYLQNTGRPIVYSCSWPFYQQNMGMTPNYSAIADHCNLWRNYGDIQDSWQSVRDIMNHYGSHQEFAEYAGPQHWNDPDMTLYLECSPLNPAPTSFLELNLIQQKIQTWIFSGRLIVGNYGLSYEQAKAQMSVWAILAAPLIMSHDLREVGYEFKQLLLNPSVIEVNQDPLGLQGRRIFVRKKKYEVWSRAVTPVVDSYTSWAFAVVNLDDGGEPMKCSFPLRYSQLLKPYTLYDYVDLFHPHVKIIPRQGKLTVRVPPLGAALIKAILRYEDDVPFSPPTQVDSPP